MSASITGSCRIPRIKPDSVRIEAPGSDAGIPPRMRVPHAVRRAGESLPPAHGGRGNSRASCGSLTRSNSQPRDGQVGLPDPVAD